MLKHRFLLKSAVLASIAGILWFSISETFSHPQSAPVKSHYGLRFSIMKNHSARNMSGSNVQTSMQVHITHWDQNYDKTQYQVFMIFTTRNINVTDVYADTPNTFISGGWYNIDKLNRTLKMHALAPLIKREENHTWLYVTAKAPASATVIASTQTTPPSNNWRIVIIAEKRQGPNISIMWSRVFSPETP